MNNTHKEHQHLSSIVEEKEPMKKIFKKEKWKKYQKNQENTVSQMTKDQEGVKTSAK